jgi:hypothetical protein
VEDLRYIVAGATQNFGFQVLQRLANPLTTGNLHLIVASRAPSVRPRIFGIGSRPEEANPHTICKTIGDVLTHRRFSLGTMDGASNISHSMPPIVERALIVRE